MKSSYEFPVSIGESLYIPRYRQTIYDELIVVGFEITNKCYVLAKTKIVKETKYTRMSQNWRIPVDQIGTRIFLTKGK